MTSTRRPEPLGGGDFDVDAVFEARGKDIMMVGGGGAAGEHQFGHGHGGGEIERLGRQPRPHRIERLQPGEQLAVERGRQRAGERLVEVVMGVDEAGQDDVLAGIVCFGADGLRCAAGGDQLDNGAVLHDHAALGAFGQDRQRVLDPDSVRSLHSSISAAIISGIASPGPEARGMDLNTIQAVARPRTRGELPAWQKGDAFLGGGTWLYSEPQVELNRLIDLGALGWTPLQAGDGGLAIAATCTVAQLEAFGASAPWTAAPLIGQCARAFLASFKIWNAATVGGNLCMSLPAGPMISLTAALDGVCTLWAADGGERQVAVTEFVRGPLDNVLQPGELLRSIALPAEALTRRTAFRQISLAPLGRSGALVIGTLSRDGKFALTITASTPRPAKLSFDSMPSAESLRTRIEKEIPGDGWYDDVHGAPAWRRHMSLHFAEEIRRELGAGAAS